VHCLLTGALCGIYTCLTQYRSKCCSRRAGNLGEPSRKRRRVDWDDEEYSQDDSDMEKEFACTHAGMQELLLGNRRKCDRFLCAAGCNKTYKRKGSLNSHIRQKHGTVTQL
jgi:hypothetical protein